MFYIKRDYRHENYMQYMNSACWIEKDNSKKISWSSPTSLIRGVHVSRHHGISVSFLGGEDGAVDM